MKFATPGNLDEVMTIFKKYKAIFPHIRSDAVLRMIDTSNVIFDNGVVITFTKYKKKTRLGTYTALKGYWILHQIVSDTQGNGSAQELLDKFFNYVDSNVVLTVRASNERAIKFYIKNGFKKVGDISWSKKTPIKGEIYKREI